MNGVFADTFYWIALTNRRDSAHRAVMEQTRRLAPRSVVTGDEVLTEFLAFCASDSLLRAVRVIPQSRSSFLEGLVLYNSRPDKGYSLTDCISMQTMRREGLMDVLTNDHHFEQEGFRRLFSDD